MQAREERESYELHAQVLKVNEAEMAALYSRMSGDSVATVGQDLVRRRGSDPSVCALSIAHGLVTHALKCVIPSEQPFSSIFTEIHFRIIKKSKA